MSAPGAPHGLDQQEEAGGQPLVYGAIPDARLLYRTDYQIIGLSVGGNLTVNGGTLQATNVLTSQSNQAASASNGSFAFQTLGFSNANNVTFGTSAGSIITASVAAAGAGSVNFSAGTTSNNLGTVVFSNSNGISFGLNGSTITASVAAGGGDAIRGIAANGSTASTSTVHFSNSNGVSFGFGAAGNSTVITASHNGVTSQTNQTGGIYVTAQSTGQSSSSTYDLRTLSFVPDGIISAGWSGGSFRVSATQSNQAASNSAGSFTFQTLNFSNANNVTFGTSAGGIITASVAAPGGGAGNTLSYFRFPPLAINTITFSFAQSTSHFVPLDIPGALSIDRLRIVASGSVAASSTQATTGNTSFSMSGRTSHNIVLYSRGTGASSLSLQYVTSSQVVDAQLMTWSIAAGNSSQHSVSLRFSLGSNSFTKDYSSSVTRFDYHTSHLTDLTGVKYIDIPLGISLSEGQWWIGYGRSTTSATQNGSISVATRMLVSHNSMIAISQNTLAMGSLGSATASSVGWFPGHGSFSTAGGGTTSSLPISAVSTTANNNVLYMQWMRLA